MPGNVLAYDAATGEHLWTFNVIPPGGRIRPRDLGERRLEVDRQRFGVGTTLRRSRPGPRLRRDRPAHHRLLRRIPSGRQPLRNLHPRHRRADRRAQVALPDRAPRRLELRQPHRAQPGGHHGRRAEHPGHRAGHQAGLGVRPEPGDRRTRVAHRGAARSAVRRARRAAVADPAPRHPPRRLRDAGDHRGRPDRLHPRAARNGARHREGLPPGSALQSPVGRGRARRYPGRDPLPRCQRRSQHPRRGSGRSRDGHPLRRGPRGAAAHRASSRGSTSTRIPMWIG